MENQPAGINGVVKRTTPKATTIADEENPKRCPQKGLEVRLGIQTKLFAGFGGVLALLVVAVAFAVTGLASVNSAAERLGTSDVPAIEAIGSVSESAQSTRRAQFSHGVASDAERMAVLEKQLAGEREEYAAAIKEYEATISNAEDRRRFEEMNDLWQQYIAASEGFLAPSRAGNEEKAVAILEGSVKEFNALNAHIDSYLEYNNERVAADVKAAADANSAARNKLLIAAFVALLVGIAIAFFIARQIRAGAQQMLVAAKGIARGELDQNVEPKTKDELGDTAQAFGEMIEYLRETAQAAEAIGNGDLTVEVVPNSRYDRMLWTGLKKKAAYLPGC